MFDKLSGYHLLLGVLAVAGAISVAFAAGGLYVILTGGTTSGDVASVPEAFTCETFNGDPEVGHEAGYGTDRNATVSRLESIDATTTDDGGFELTINISDPAILNASARQADGTPVSVEQLENATVRVSHNDTSPVRVWVDSADGGRITRTELDICPPETDGE